METHPPRPSLSSVIPTLLPLVTHGEQGDHFIGKFWHQTRNMSRVERVSRPLQRSTFF
jgi:hypothetical protein